MKKELYFGFILLVLFSLSFNLVIADEWDDFLADDGSGDVVDDGSGDVVDVVDNEGVVDDEVDDEPSTDSQTTTQPPSSNQDYKFSFKDYEITWKFYVALVLGLIVIGIIAFLVISLRKKI